MHGKLFLTLGGEQRELFFNNYCREEIGVTYGIDPMEAAVKLAEEVAAARYMKPLNIIIHAAIVGAFSVKMQPCPITKEQVAEWAAEISDADMISIFNTWKATYEIPEIIPAQNIKEKASTTKKKNAGKT